MRRGIVYEYISTMVRPRRSNKKARLFVMKTKAPDSLGMLYVAAMAAALRYQGAL